MLYNLEATHYRGGGGVYSVDSTALISVVLHVFFFMNGSSIISEIESVSIPPWIPWLRLEGFLGGMFSALDKLLRDSSVFVN